MENKYEDLKYVNLSTNAWHGKGESGFSISWEANSLGYGNVSFLCDEEGNMKIDSECMSKEFVKALLCDMVDNSEFK